MGTPEFSVPSLEILVSKGYNVVGVYTQVDKPSKNLKVVDCPVKVCATKHDIPVFQFLKLRQEDGVQSLRDLKPDIVITAAFGQLLTQTILDIPTIGVYNVHASLLPKYRGGCPIHWCIIDGNIETGITIMRTEKGLDTGPILLQIPCEIGNDDTYDEVYTRLSKLGAVALDEFLNKFDTFVEIPQDDSSSSYQPIIQKSDGKINWNNSSQQVHNHIRGVTSSPGAYCTHGDAILKIHKTKLIDASDKRLNNLKSNELFSSNENILAGTVVCADRKNGLVVACNQGFVEILELQAPNKKRLSSKDFLNGNSLKVNDILGEF